MAKVTLTNLTNLENQISAVNSINNNNGIIEAAFENTLSRDGSTPNQMSADLDMNSNQILNLPEPSSDTSPVRLIDLNNVSSGGTFVMPKPSISSLGGIYARTPVANQFVTGLDTNGNLTASQPSVSNLSEGTTGTGPVVRNSSPTLTTPVINSPTISSPTMTNPVVGTQTPGNNSTLAASTAFVNTAITTNNSNIHKGIYLNILDYGGNDDGVTTNDTALANAIAALPDSGGTIMFPAANTGKYVFGAKFEFTFPNRRYSLCLTGSAPNSCVLHWPNADGGLHLTYGVIYGQGCSVRNLSLTTGTTDGGTALKFSNPYRQDFFPAQSSIQDVTIHPDDRGFAGVHYWTTALEINGISTINITNCQFENKWAGGAGNAVGTGAYIHGNVGTNGGADNYCLLPNFVNCVWTNFSNHLLYGSYVQGMSMVNCNMGGQNGTCGIFSPSGTAGIQAQIYCVNCQLDTGSRQVYFVSPVLQTAFTGCTFTTSANGGVAVELDQSYITHITGCSFNTGGSPAASDTYGVVIGGPGVGTIIGNDFFNNVGYVWNSGTNYLKGQSNIFPYAYATITTAFINNGSSLAPGTPGG